MDDVTLSLTADQALVLSDWLDRAMHTAAFEAAVDDRAVWSPLLSISAALDKRLVMVFDPAYRTRLEQARERLIEELGDFRAG
ncbi:hypothetical protein [Allonocardiopsis opalescens]|uniref:Uncharacterized protein n=1 Tax=Allonocardiopsis opalescens TaxID=1144618 RepID=A0A2T0Q1Z1_9ACTN|nr:hypothetical protein [Allonocardiopsis opalescens]PRX97730.1 hypothetical protein CLV72_10580 [Allonocardiopsis opalescens]